MEPTLKYAIVAIVLGLLLSLNPIRPFTFSEASTLITVIGIVYGIIAAFMINAADQRFDEIRDGISEEVNSFIAVALLSKRFKNKAFFNRVVKSLTPYAKFLADSSVKSLADSEDVFVYLRSLAKTIAEAPVKTVKQQLLFDQIESEMTKIADSREKQLLVLNSRTSISEWALILFFSFFLLVLVIFMQFPQTGALETFLLTSGVVISVMLLPIALYHIDFMAIEAKNISTTPYLSVIRVIHSKTL